MSHLVMQLFDAIDYPAGTGPAHPEQENDPMSTYSEAQTRAIALATARVAAQRGIAPDSAADLVFAAAKQEFSTTQELADRVLKAADPVVQALAAQDAPFPPAA